MAHPTPISNHPLYRLRAEFLTNDERVALAYQRAKLVLDTYKLCAEDILHCSPKYWAMQSDPAMPLDGACFTIISAHVGLTIGTLARHAQSRPDLLPLLHRLLAFDTVGLYLLSERGHGLDSFNIETTATKTETGFILNTPREEAAKMMPATTPLFGIPKVALVMARLIVDGTDRGPRFFIVPICDKKEMCRGVTSTRLPRLSGTSPLDFAITNFHNVHLPPSALLYEPRCSEGSPRRLVGRSVADPHWKRCGAPLDSARVPIITFRTQQWPVLQAIAVAMVLDSWYSQVIQHTVDVSTEPQVRHGLSVVVKTTVCRQFLTCIRDLLRDGAQEILTTTSSLVLRQTDAASSLPKATSPHSAFASSANSFSAATPSLRPPSPNPCSLDTHPPSSSTMQASSRTLPGGHRGASANALVTPQAESAIQALGHAYAYAAAARAGSPSPCLTSTSASPSAQTLRGTLSVPAWTAPHSVRQARAVTCALPHLQEYLDALDLRSTSRLPSSKTTFGRLA
ncbi:Acyl-coenzyme A oxidase-like protein [Grifola frondosa]|uniref:Acyl-coenzyme A oxidase-like protein n=1 Tax=Grifola frondosa TaxID=5627 RepID=A0A1C7MPN0_GRIFR|nr:Acyl-coenzyme A oxidase-like protein [Grifola frondosa]